MESVMKLKVQGIPIAPKFAFFSPYILDKGVSPAPLATHLRALGGKPLILLAPSKKLNKASCKSNQTVTRVYHIHNQRIC